MPTFSSFLRLWQLPRAQAVDLFLDLLSRSGTEAGTSQHQGTAASSGEHLRELALLLAWVGLLPALPCDFRQMIYLVVNNFCSCPPAIRADDFPSCPPLPSHSAFPGLCMQMSPEPLPPLTLWWLHLHVPGGRQKESHAKASSDESQLVSINSITLCMGSRGV